MTYQNTQIIFATGNKGKIREIKEILSCRPQIEVLSMREADAEVSPEENGADFEDNALIKAQAVYDRLLSRPAPEGTVRLIMSDDSGLVIDALDGAPGVHSARYMGYDTDYRIRMEHILSLMKDVPEEKRTARFVAAVAAILPDGSSRVVRAAMEGRIGYSIAGQNGFGYDPFFYLPQYGMTSAEISPEEKNRISHRGQALRKMLTELDLLS
ncbi:MAG: RdgB/HAM1 family non-canonical purine NTP pyrophosphatase [Eubacteriales bacterium]|nr:RdgB/HAM1 family non-canonical purine NTP pyrophosphatase [Eubacteriales bacterium]